jgi:hypothetical protein
MPSLVRMFHLADELERCRRVFREKRVVEGSSGQPVINPVGSYMLALAKEVRALEDRFGANAMARLRFVGRAGWRASEFGCDQLPDDAGLRWVDVVRVDPRFGITAD